MSGTMAVDSNYDQEGVKWRFMLVLSLILHGVLFSALFWVPGNSSGGLSMNEVVYEVNLEEMPKSGQSSAPASQKAVTRAASVDNKKARRISSSPRETNTVPIHKRNAKRIKSKPEKDQISSSQLLDNAISNIEKKVKTEKNGNYLDKTIADLEKKLDTSGGSSGAGASVGSLAINRYKMKVDAQIKSHWVYSGTTGNEEKLEATVLVRISRDGTVLGVEFLRHSRNGKFDESVLKAIEKAKPLPPLPQGYRENYGEIEIDFILKDLE